MRAVQVGLSEELRCCRKRQHRGHPSYVRDDDGPPWLTFCTHCGGDAEGWIQRKIRAQVKASRRSTTAVSRACPRWRAGMTAHVEAARERLEAQRPTNRAVDAGFRWVQLQTETGGALLAGAIAFRIFLFLLPCVFAVVVGQSLGRIHRDIGKMPPAHESWRPRQP